MSQCSQIFVHLSDRGPITPAQAYQLYGTLALHSRISELRERGIPVKCELVEVNGKHVGRYSLERPAP